jgi:hypothetical protein
MADRKMADRKMADREMEDRKMEDRKMEEWKIGKEDNYDEICGFTITAVHANH